MTMVRLNAAHTNSPEVLYGFTELLKLHCPGVKVILDLPGADNRISGLSEPLTLAPGDTLTLHGRELRLTTTGVGVAPGIIESARPDMTVSFMNGEIAGLVISNHNGLVRLHLQDGGVLRPQAHVSLEGRDGAAGSVDWDPELVRFATLAGLDYLALSSVEDEQVILALKARLLALRPNGPLPRVIAKFETLASLHNQDRVIAAGDAFFVARGDLGFAIPPEAIPLAQKRLIASCNQAGKPVFVATQMLSSMVERLSPTRAELSDVANAVLDGADAITLSEETAIGRHPLEVVQTARRIIDRTQRGLSDLFSIPLDLSDADLIARLESLSPAFKQILARVKAVAREISRNGWAEANGGNFSINVSEAVNQLYNSRSDWFLVSRTGSRYRDTATDPAAGTLLVEVFGKAEGCYPQGANPTSEWNCHRGLQMRRSKGPNSASVVLHSHPDEIIRLSQLELYNDPKRLSAALWEALPELPLFLPKGVAVALFAPAGSKQLAECSLKAIGDRDALIWQGHGLICLGRDIDEAFDRMEVVAKAARLLLMRLDGLQT